MQYLVDSVYHLLDLDMADMTSGMGELIANCTEDSVDLNCTETNDSFPCYSLSETHMAGIIVHACVLTVCILSSLITNGLVILLVMKYKRLRVRSVILSLSVVAADVLLSLSYTLPTLVTTIARKWVFTDAGCTAFAFLAHEFLITRWLIMGMLCLDRFLTVRFPFKYRIYSKKILIVLAVLSWTIPFLLALPVVHSFSKGSLRHNVPTCLPVCETFGCKLYYASCLSVAFFIGCILPIILYSWLYYKSKKYRRSTLYLGEATVKITGGTLVGTSMTDFFSNPRERRAVYTFLLILVTVIVTGLPSYMSQTVRSISLEVHCRVPIYVYFIITELLVSASTLNALVIMRDRDFRHCIKHLFCCNKYSRTGDSWTNKCQRSSVIVGTTSPTPSSPSPDTLGPDFNACMKNGHIQTATVLNDTNKLPSMYVIQGTPLKEISSSPEE